MAFKYKRSDIEIQLLLERANEIILGEDPEGDLFQHLSSFSNNRAAIDKAIKIIMQEKFEEAKG